MRVKKWPIIPDGAGVEGWLLTLPHLSEKIGNEKFSKNYCKLTMGSGKITPRTNVRFFQSITKYTNFKTLGHLPDAGWSAFVNKECRT